MTFILMLLVIQLNAQTSTKCFEFESILVDACGAPEQLNEMMRIRIGANDLNVGNMSIHYQNTTFPGLCQNANTAAHTAALNRSIRSCGWLLEPVGGVLPANKQVIIVTSENMDTLANSFATLEDTIYILYQCGNPGTAQFKNYQSGAGPRTTFITFSGAGGCADTVTYIVDSLINQSGNHSSSNGDGATVTFGLTGPPVYTNNGCQAPFVGLSVRAQPDTIVCPRVALSVRATATGYRHIRWVGGLGSFINPDSLNAVYQPSPADTYPLQLIVKAFTDCVNDTLRDTLRVNSFLITAAASPDTFVCTGGSVTISATGGTTYTWNADPSLTCNICQSPVASPASSIGYPVAIVDANNCTTYDTVMVQIRTYPLLTASNDTSICSGYNLQLNATSSDPVNWSGTGLSCNLCNNPVVQPTSNSSYYIATTGSCVSRDTVNVTAIPLVNPSITIASAPSTICSNSTVTFTSNITNGGVNPQYQWIKNGVTLPTQTQSTYVDSFFSNNDSVRCLLTISTACANPATVSSNLIVLSVQPNVIPLVTVSSIADTICTGSNITFTANATNGGNSPQYVWYRNGAIVGANQNTYSDNTINDGDSVWCELTSNALCAIPNKAVSNKKKTVVKIPVTPTVSITADVDTICQGGTVNFTATATNAGANPVWQWYRAGAGVGLNSSTFSTNQLNNLDSVWVQLTSNAYCAAPTIVLSNKIAVVVNPVLVPTISVSPSQNNFCGTQNVDFTATITNGGTLPVIQWSLNGNPVGSNATLYTNNTLANGDVITATLTSNAVCANPTQVTALPVSMVINPIVTPAITISANKSGTCKGEAVTFTATLVNGGNSPQVDWQIDGAPAGTGTTISFSNLTSASIVTATLTSDAPCPNPVMVLSNTVSVTVTDYPSVNAGRDTIIDQGQSVILTATGNAGSYVWTPLQYLNTNSGASVRSTPEATIVYTVTGSSNGCAATDSVKVTVIPVAHPDTIVLVPTAFSPNNDGKNDFFRIVNAFQFKEAAMRVYNRWGELVFSSDDVNDAWDGTHHGVPQPTEVYAVVIHVVTNGGKTIEYGGNVTLLR
ncbi:MAG: gliding motility-associated C-terminal domain-containing protein [Chitinophagales bacterium]